MSRTFVRASSQYAEALSSPIHFGGSLASAPFSMAGWYRPSSIENGSILGIGETISNQYMALGMDPTGLAFIEVSGANITSGAALPLNQWSHIGAVQASTTSRFAFRNGVKGLQSTTAQPAHTGRDRITVGGLILNGTRVSFAGGDIAELGVWNIVLTDQEMADLAAGVLPSDIAPANLVGYWSFAEDLGATEPDLSSGGRTLTIVGAAFSVQHPTMIGGEPPQIIRPDADIETIGWATAPLFSKINDDSDATVITGALS